MQVGNPLLCDASRLLRQTAVYHCSSQLWRALSSYSEDRTAGIPEGSSYDQELMALVLGLASRLFSYQKAAMVEQPEKEKLSPHFSSTRTCLTTCRPRKLETDSGTESLVNSYHSISPSPSELALPNVAYSAAMKDEEEVDHDTLFGRVEYGSLVVLRESLLPLFSAAGLGVEPQLFTLCHNSSDVFVDFTVKLREAAISVAETIHPGGVGRASDLPYILLAEQFVMNGLLKYSTESSIQHSPPLSLIASHAVTKEVLGATLISKLNVTSQCCISFDSITSNVTVPLLKLARHMSKTSKLRLHWRARFRRATAVEAEDAVQPSPPVETEESITPTPATAGREHVAIDMDEPDFSPSPLHASPPPPSSNAWNFSHGLVRYLIGRQQGAVPVRSSPEKTSAVNTPPSSASSLHSSSRVRLMKLSRSPRLPHPRISLTSSNQATPFSVPTLEPCSDTTPAEEAPKAPVYSSVDVDDTDGDGIVSPDEHPSARDTYAGDTSDSHHIASSDNEQPGSLNQYSSLFIDPMLSLNSDTSGAAALPLGFSLVNDMLPLQMALTLKESELLFSVFGLVRVNSVQVNFQVETTRATFDIMGISGSIDVRKHFSRSRAKSGQHSSRDTEDKDDSDFIAEGESSLAIQCTLI